MINDPTSSTTPPEPRAKDRLKEMFELYGRDTFMAVHEVISTLQDLYQAKWPHMYLQNDCDIYYGEHYFWCKILKNIEPRFIKIAVDSILNDETSFSGWPPTAVQFLGLCKDARVDESNKLSTKIETENEDLEA